MVTRPDALREFNLQTGDAPPSAQPARHPFVLTLVIAGLITIANFAVTGLYDLICLRGAQVRPRECWWNRDARLCL